MNLTTFDQFIIVAIIILLSILILVSSYNRRRERAKKKAELVFGEPLKKPKRKKIVFDETKCQKLKINKKKV